MLRLCWSCRDGARVAGRAGDFVNNPALVISVKVYQIGEPCGLCMAFRRWWFIIAKTIDCVAGVSLCVWNGVW